MPARNFLFVIVALALTGMTAAGRSKTMQRMVDQLNFTLVRRFFVRWQIRLIVSPRTRAVSTHLSLAITTADVVRPRRAIPNTGEPRVAAGRRGFLAREPASAAMAFVAVCTERAALRRHPPTVVRARTAAVALPTAAVIVRSHVLNMFQVTCVCGRLQPPRSLLLHRHRLLHSRTLLGGNMYVGVVGAF